MANTPFAPWNATYESQIVQMERYGCPVTTKSGNEVYYRFMIAHFYIKQLTDFFTTKGYPPVRYELERGSRREFICVYWLEQPRWAPVCRTFHSLRHLRQYAGFTREAADDLTTTSLRRQLVALEKRRQEILDILATEEPAVIVK